MIRFLILILAIQIIIFGCKPDNSDLNKIIDDRFHFSIFKYEVNLIIDLFFERYRLKKTEPKKNQIKKLLIEELYDQEMDYFYQEIEQTYFIGG